ncbi:MAG TPA: glycosyltransferase [Gemmatimonadaceae bacterium]|nr:glycosyltransferase [Gemmatimonadaceae bacterium]
MKVVHVLAPATFGGLERVVHALATGQQRRGHDVHVILLLESGVAEPLIAEQLRDGAVPVISIVLPGRAYWTQLRLLREHCARLVPDVIHTHGYLPDVLSTLLIPKISAHRVSTVHGFIGSTRRGRFYEWLQCRAYRWIDAVAVSNKLATDLIDRGVPAHNVHVIANAAVAIDDPLSREAARQRLGVPGEMFSIGWIGRVSHEKGLDVLIDALPALRGIPAQLTVIGDGPGRRALDEKARRIADHVPVSWAGVIPDAARLLRAFDVLVISSRTEGTPMTLLEAMAAEVPIVATAVGGIPDVVTNDQAILVPSENPAALAAAIRSVYDDCDAARQRAERAAVRLATAFSTENWLTQYDQLYAMLIARSPNARA